MNQLLAHLERHEVFAALSQKELKHLAPILSEQFYEEGEMVFDQHQLGDYLFYILDGRFMLKLPNEEYKNLVPGQLFGEIGMLNADFRSGSVMAAEASNVIKICGTRLFQEEHIPATVALKIVRALSKRVTNYLRSKEQISTKELIENGEDDNTEFKSTLRYNLYTQKPDKAIENASLKTLVAFMNSEGGTLLIGVGDDGELLGLEADKFQNHDKRLLHLTHLVESRIGSLFVKFLHFTIEQVSEQEILRIDCWPATMPAYLDDGNKEHFYIRNGPSTTDLKLSKVYLYIKERFYSNA